MKYPLWVCLALVCFNAFGQDRDSGSRLLRRITLAAACGASFWDYHTTLEASRYGGTETNGLFSSGGRAPRLGLILGVKAGLCGVSAIAQEKRLLGRLGGRLADSLWTSVNMGLTATFTAAALHNMSVIRELRQQSQPTLPAYLAAGAGQ